MQLDMHTLACTGNEVLPEQHQLEYHPLHSPIAICHGMKPGKAGIPGVLDEGTFLDEVYLFP